MRVIERVTPDIAEQCSADSLNRAYVLPPAKFLTTVGGLVADQQNGRPTFPNDYIEADSSDWITCGPNEGRLVSKLRNLIDPQLNPGAPDPVATLARASVELYMSTLGDVPFAGDEDFALAMAQLAVTGRKSYHRFWSQQPQDAEVLDAAQSMLNGRPFNTTAPRSEMASHVSFILTQAYLTAWMLRGGVNTRRSRDQRGWIAVSGEDDPPHRPVNVPSAPFPQYDLDLRTNSVNTTIRYMVATRELPEFDQLGLESIQTRAAPPNTQPDIPEDHEIILFLHGHSSRAEEALELIPHLFACGEEQGKNYAVIALDFPNCGYSSMFNHLTHFPFSPEEQNGHFVQKPDAYKVLDFYENIIDSFLDELQRQHGIRNKIAAVIGGSLGGNLGLRIGTQGRSQHSWLNKVVAWSPASVWNSFAETGDVGKAETLRKLRGRTLAPEAEIRRKEYFGHVFRFEIAGTIPEQPVMWFRPTWRPCKGFGMVGSFLDRVEIYNEHFRQNNWRVAFEQLVFSHWDTASSTGRAYYEGNRTSTLLLAAEEDNYNYSHIHDATLNLARAMVDTPGTAILVRDTGHSIQAERPEWLAKRIAEFLNDGTLQGEYVFSHHAHEVSIENSENIYEVVQAGYHTVIRGLRARHAWIHLAIPTPVITDNQRRQIKGIKLEYLTGRDSRITNVHLFDGERIILEHNGLNISDDQWMSRSFLLPEYHSVRYGIGISINVMFGEGSENNNEFILGSAAAAFG